RLLRGNPKHRAACQKQAGPVLRVRSTGPTQRTTLVGLGAVRDPRERGRCSRARSTSLSRATAYRCRGPEREEIMRGTTHFAELGNQVRNLCASATLVVVGVPDRPLRAAVRDDA